MNFKLKALAAALALAVTLPAHAAIDKTETGDSSMILSLINNTTKVSATFDLGYNLSTFNQAANNSWNLSTADYTSAWTSFFAATTAGNDVQYAVFAGDGFGGVVAGDKSMFVTSSLTALANTGNAPLGNSLVAMDNYITASNLLGNHGTVANGASYATQLLNPTAYAGANTTYGTTGKINATGSDNTVALNANANVFNIVRTGVSGNATSTMLPATYFNLSSTGALTYVAPVAAVPEADTSAMMLAGLGLMGFIARRRRNNVA